MAVLTCGELKKYKDEIPVLEILVDGEVEGYLSPFRGYHFQVSKTFEGEMSLGQSYNYDNKLSQFLSIYTRSSGMASSGELECMAALAMSAIVSFTRYPRICEKYGDVCIGVKVREFVKSPFDSFIEESTRWILSTCSK